jgi:hypothetical protein
MFMGDLISTGPLAKLCGQLLLEPKLANESFPTTLAHIHDWVFLSGLGSLPSGLSIPSLSVFRSHPCVVRSQPGHELWIVFVPIVPRSIILFLPESSHQFIELSIFLALSPVLHPAFPAVELIAVNFSFVVESDVFKCREHYCLPLNPMFNGPDSL